MPKISGTYVVIATGMISDRDFHVFRLTFLGDFARQLATWMTVTSLLMSPAFSWAGPSVFKQPLKMQVCEMFLSPEVKAFASPDDVRTSIRDVAHMIKKAILAATSDGTSYEPVNYLGPLENIDFKSGRTIVERLQGIDQELTETSLDRQIVALEFRGENALRAIEEMNLQKQKLDLIYQHAEQNYINGRVRFASKVLKSFTYAAPIILNTLFISTISDFDNSTFFSGMMAIFSNLLAYRQIAIEVGHAARKNSWNFSGIKNFFSNQISRANINQLFYSGESIDLPVEFSKYLMSGKSTEDGFQARHLGLQLWGGNSIENMLALPGYQEILAQRNERRVRNAGELYRHIEIDQVAYFDKESNEPVLLFVFRSYRSQPTGKKPTKKTEEKTSTELQWEPGLNPAPVPVKVR